MGIETVQIEIRTAQEFGAAAGAILGGAEAAAVAIHHGRIVGFMRWRYEPDPDGKALIESGTWVAPRYRRKGLATKLWNACIQEEKPIRVTTAADTKDGAEFIKAALSMLKIVVVVKPADLLRLVQESRFPGIPPPLPVVPSVGLDPEIVVCPWCPHPAHYGQHCKAPAERIFGCGCKGTGEVQT